MAMRAAQKRSVATRAALLDAAIECLVKRGYAATTTIETARRAGVSRGAELHHFPSKAELLTTAVDHLFDRRRAEFGNRFDHWSMVSASFAACAVFW